MHGRILLADDDPKTLGFLRLILDDAEQGLEVVGEAANGQEAVALAMRTQPDVVLLDFFMPEKSGMEAAMEIRDMLPTTHVILFTGLKERWMLEKGVDRDVFAILPKGTSVSGILDVVLKAVATPCQPVIIPEPHLATELSTEPVSNDELLRSLSPAEERVLELYAVGYTDQQTADRLGVALETIKTHAKHILTKLRVHKRTQAVLRFRQTRR